MISKDMVIRCFSTFSLNHDQIVHSFGHTGQKYCRISDGTHLYIHYIR